MTARSIRILSNAGAGSSSAIIPGLACGEGGLKLLRQVEEIRTGVERPFWVANISELFERLSYYAAFASLARYLHEVLGFPTERASGLSGLFGGLVWLLAIFGGAIADRLGLRRCAIRCRWDFLWA